MVFEAETQLIEPDTSQWEGGCWHILLRPSIRPRLQLQLSWPAQNRGGHLCCTSAFCNTQTKNAKAQLMVLKHLQLLAVAAAPLPALSS